MDQIPRSNEGFANNSLFQDSQQYNAYDSLFQSGNDQSLNDASWGVNASGYPSLSRGLSQATPSWPQNASHLSASSTRQSSATPQGQYGRSPLHSPAPYTQQNQFGGYGTQNYQYQQPQFDPALVNPSTSTQNHGFGYPRLDTPSSNTGTVALQAIEREARPPIHDNDHYDGMDYHVTANEQQRTNKPPSVSLVDQNALAAAVPRGNEAGDFTIINFDQLIRATNSERMGNFLTIGKDAHEWPVNRASLPKYDARKSRNDLRKLAGNDARLLAKIGKKSAKKEKTLTAAPRPMKPISVPATASSPSGIKYEEVSSSEEESSDDDDDDDSSYTSEEANEPTPLPSKRPDDPKGAVEYDTIKALWRPKRRTVDGQDLRKALGAFWDVVKTIRDRWKIDANAVTEAEEKKRVGELPLLRSRVKDQRDMIESAFKAALKYSHKGILELLAENVPFIFLCYQFLLDRFKVEDQNGPLARVILETMSHFTTLTEETMNKTNFAKVLPRYIKKGDAKTSFYAKKIDANARTATMKMVNNALSTKVAAPSTDNAAPSPTTKRAEPEPVAGIKRAASSAGTGTVQKKVATGAFKVNGDATVRRPSDTLKKPAGTLSKPIAMTSTLPTAKPKAVAKPSGFFSSLQSASKKPGATVVSKPGQTVTAAASIKLAEKKPSVAAAANAAPKSAFSFSETMANLMKPKEEKPTPTKQKKEEEKLDESPEQKAKRVRKESRRGLRVSFKPEDELVAVRLFTHDPEEEIDHDSSQTRDISDVGGEGRMLKQHRDQMELDDEDDEDEKLVEFKTPSAIDFSNVDKEERKRNFAPFGGGELQPESPERAAREQYEANTLIVFYNDESDIPPNPREPTDPYNGDQTGTTKAFGAPPQKIADRAHQRKPQPPPQWQMQQQQQTPAFPNYAAFAPSMGGQQQQPSVQQPQQPASMADLAKILERFQPQQPTQAAPHSTPQMIPPGQPDISEILRTLTGGNSNGQAPPLPFNTPGMPNMAGFQPQMQQGAGGWPQGTKKRETQAEIEEKRKSMPFYKTRVCKYWQDGKCSRGDDCNYLHE